MAIIGSGPAGFYVADSIFKKKPSGAVVDMFDLLPTPHGLVRHGVAPDHQKIKAISKVYDKIADNPDFRFFGLVEFGKDIVLTDLKSRYHQIVFATGAQTDRKLGIPGEDAEGSRTATEFVAWYNGHPHFSHLDFNLSCERAVVIGVGNVAVDVARILCLSENERKKTDMADYAEKKLAVSNIREIVMAGRRGPAQAAFTNPELRELTALEEAVPSTFADEMRMDTMTQNLLKLNPDVQTERKLEILSGFSGRTASKKKTLRLRFLLSPVSIETDAKGRVCGVTFEKNRIEKRNGNMVAVGTGETETIEAGIVFRSIGYRGVKLTDIPFDDTAGRIPNTDGRVIDGPGGMTLTGLYTAGWIKRGPIGVIGTNKADSSRIVDLMLEDFAHGKRLEPSEPEGSISALLEERNMPYVNYAEWKKLDGMEKELGEKEGKPRVKYTKIKDMLTALGKC